MILDILNHRLKKVCLDYSVLIIHGQRASGKSSLFALIAQEALKQGREVYCQYPYDRVHKIPMKEYKVGKVVRFDIDKDWLYSHEFEEYAVVLIDESSTIWPARSYAKWTQADSDFFNFIRKQHITLILACQYYDQLDLNVKRSADGSFFLNESLHFRNFTLIEECKLLTVKVADKNTELLGQAFKRGARKVTYDVCEIPLRNYRFYRKPYYDKFLTDYVPFIKTSQPQPLWNEFVDFST